MSEPPTGPAAEFAARLGAVVMPPSVPPGVRLELLRARIRPGKSGRADEWMRMLNDRLAECVATLRRERVAFEAQFRLVDADGADWLYHLSVYGSGGGVLDETAAAIDADHGAFSRECKERGWEILDPQLFLATDAVRDAMVAATRP